MTFLNTIPLINAVKVSMVVSEFCGKNGLCRCDEEPVAEAVEVNSKQWVRVSIALSLQGGSIKEHH